MNGRIRGRSSAIINDQKATAIIQHMTYTMIDDHYNTDVFTEPTIKGKLDTNAMKAKKHLYDHVVYDSTNERNFATELENPTEPTDPDTPSGDNVCKWDNVDHGASFWGKIIRFFHSILYFFAHLFGRK